jgi:hypothetical protein
LFGNGTVWLPRPEAKLQKLTKLMWGAKDIVVAWKCTNCKKIELEVE